MGHSTRSDTGSIHCPLNAVWSVTSQAVGNGPVCVCSQLLKHLYLAVRHNDADKVVGLVRAGADQFAEVEGTGLNPREEAKRQGLYDILRQMAALAKKEPQHEDDKILALEDVYRLFEVSSTRRWRSLH